MIWLANWRLLLGGLGAILLALGVWKVSDWRNEAAKVPGLELAILECQKSKVITAEANHDLQQDRERIATDLARYKRLHPSSCVQLGHKTDLIYGGAKYARADGGITGTSDDFRGYAATCEQYRSERITLEKFIDRQTTPPASP